MEKLNKESLQTKQSHSWDNTVLNVRGRGRGDQVAREEAVWEERCPKEQVPPISSVFRFPRNECPAITWRGSQSLKGANGKPANLPPPSPPMPACGQSPTEGPEWPARPWMCAPIYTTFLATGRSNCQRALDHCGTGKQGEVFTIEYPARIYGKPAQNPSQSPTQVLEPLTLLCWTLCSGGSWHRFCRLK